MYKQSHLAEVRLQLSYFWSEKKKKERQKICFGKLHSCMNVKHPLWNKIYNLLHSNQTYTHSPADRSWSVFMHDCFAVELTGECLECSFRLMRGGPYLRGVISSTVGAYPRGTGSNPVEGNGHFFPSYRQLHLSSFSDKHTHTHTHTHTNLSQCR